MLLLIYSVFLKITAALSVKHCYQCSDSNIETHYGAFFANPRVLQEGNRNQLQKCDRFAVPVIECDGPCYSLNVTSLHVKDRDVLPFGSAYGCSQYVLSEEIESQPDCTKKDILLRTIPPYVVQAEYCKCDGDLCNRITHIVAIPRRVPSGKPNFHVNYQKNSYRSAFSDLFLFILLLATTR